MEKSSFFQEILSLPSDLLSYEAGRRLKEMHPTAIEIQLWSFDVDSYAQEGHCTLTPRGDLHQQRPIAGCSEGQLSRRCINGWQEVRWGEQQFELLKLSWTQGYQIEERSFLIAEDPQQAEDFIREVCEWNEEVRGEVLVFHDGFWTKDKELYQSTRGVSFEDLVLPEGMGQELCRDVVDFFQCEELYSRYKIPWKRGVLLHGPPGNGKTHAVKAILNLVDMPRLYVKSFRSSCYTEEECIRQVFKRARDVAPCVLIFEDLDAFLSDENRSFFLNEIDGFAPNHGILTLATTNHVERLDEALVKRPSRFDRKYRFGLPGQQERQRYIAQWNHNLEAGLQIDAHALQQVAELTEGFSYAFIKELFVSSLMSWLKEAQAGAMSKELLAQARLLQQQLTPKS